MSGTSRSKCDLEVDVTHPASTADIFAWWTGVVTLSALTFVATAAALIAAVHAAGTATFVFRLWRAGGMRAELNGLQQIQGAFALFASYFLDSPDAVHLEQRDSPKREARRIDWPRL